MSGRTPGGRRRDRLSDTPPAMSLRPAHVRPQHGGTRVLARVLVTLCTVACLAPASLAAGAPTGQMSALRVNRCGFIHASVPYSRHGNRDRWGVYVSARTTCAAAKTVLSAVMHLRASAHEGSGNANSYFSYDGWRCAFGQMGDQPCWQPVTHPYRAAAIARNCADQPDGGCPVRIPHNDLP